MSFLTVPEVAQQLAVSRGLVYKLIDKGDLQAVKIATAVRISKDALDAYLKKDHLYSYSQTNSSKS
jgi:excisionase family DNA binding protein